jgi:hypothetical protein
LAVEVRIADGVDAGLAIHLTTGLDALWRIWLRAAPELRPLVLGVAVRRVLRLHQREAVETPCVLDLPPGPGVAFGPYETSRIARYRAGLAHVVRDRPGYLAETRRRVLHHGQDAHAFKYWGAVMDINDRLQPRLAPRWLAAHALAYSMSAATRWHRAREAEMLIGSLGG